VLSSDDRVVIVGAGLAGGNVAARLREEGFAGRVLLLGDEPGIPFGRPPLSKTYLRGEGTLDGWYVKPADWWDAHGVERRTGVVVDVDVDAREVVLADGARVAWDRLVWCAGGRPRALPIPGAELSGVHLLRRVADCDAIKCAVRPGVRVVVVGMGFIGSEVAASLRQLGASVTVVMRDAVALERVLGADVGGVMGAIHREHGVEVLPSSGVVRLEGDGVVQRAVTDGGVALQCDLVVIGAGIIPNVELLQGTSVALDNGVLVDAQCRSSVATVSAAGDCANQLHPLFGRVRVEHYNNAEKMGRYVARSLLGDDAPYDYLHTFWSDQYEHSLEYVGHATQWDDVAIRGSLEERRFLAFYLQRGVVLAIAGLNRGGDPELDEDGELYALKPLVAAQAVVPREVLTDEAVDAHALASRFAAGVTP